MELVYFNITQVAKFIAANFVTTSQLASEKFGNQMGPSSISRLLKGRKTVSVLKFARMEISSKGHIIMVKKYLKLINWLTAERDQRSTKIPWKE
jgi:hypothetical protein